ncbi:MAG TPA: hypothetical protein VIY48_16280 [Candidatus Paceibacterota bacterium]
MNFASHSAQVSGRHAFLSPSNYHWVNYDEEKLDRVFFTAMAAQRGTELHALAHQLIKLGVKLPDVPKSLNQYVNDAIGFRMTSEQVLYYSENCFGTADTICFRKNMLRIHDYKSGATPASVRQLEVYMALFCLEYRFKPFDIDAELRIYQNDEVQIYKPDMDVIFHIMDKIVTFDKRIDYLKAEVGS